MAKRAGGSSKTLTVYEFDHDEAYQFVEMHDDEEDLLSEIVRRKRWKPPRLETCKRKRKKGDFWHFCGDPLILGEKAVEALRELLEPAGKLLPMEHEGMRLWAYYTTQIIDCLDIKRSTIDKKSEVIRKYVFKPGPLRDVAVFGIPQYTWSLFVTDRFRSAVEQAGLRGGEFTQIWRNGSK